MAINAVDLLNDFIGDLITGVMVFREYNLAYQSRRLTLQQMVPIQKMCLSHLMLSLTKWLELYQRYHSIIPDECRDVCRSLNRTIRSKGIPEFRNKCIGHIWDKKRQRPLVQSEIMTQLETITGGNLPDFLTWINDPTDNSYPKSVVSIVERIRDLLTAAHRIAMQEVIDR